MSLNLENEGNLIAVIQNKNKEIKDKKLYVSDDEEKVRNGGPVFNCSPDEKLQLVPNPEVERQCLYVCGQSGSGKSYFTSEYVKHYKKTHPKNNVYVISSIFEDKSIDSLKPKRINVMDPEFMDEDILAEDFKNSIVVFDDVDVFPKNIRRKVMEIVNSILQIGRHYNVSIVFTVHNPNKGQETKILLTEANIITVFPKTTGNAALKYLLDNYLGLDSKQIKEIKKMKTRAVSIIRGYPTVILAEKVALLAHELT